MYKDDVIKIEAKNVAITDFLCIFQQKENFGENLMFGCQGNAKIRSPFHAVTDWIYCPEAPESPRLQATGFLGLQGSKSSQLLHGRDFLILFHHFLKQNRMYL